MACDLCGAKGTSLTRLLDDYKTAEVQEICPDCEKVVNDQLWKIRAVTANINKSLLRRFIDGLLRRNAGVLASGEVAPRETQLHRETLGQIVRHEWLRWAREQPSPKQSWLQPWGELTEPEREVDRRIGEAILSHVRIVDAATFPAGVSGKGGETVPPSDALDARPIRTSTDDEEVKPSGGNGM